MVKCLSCTRKVAGLIPVGFYLFNFLISKEFRIFPPISSNSLLRIIRSSDNLSDRIGHLRRSSQRECARVRDRVSAMSFEGADADRVEVELEIGGRGQWNPGDERSAVCRVHTAVGNRAAGDVFGSAGVENVDVEDGLGEKALVDDRRNDGLDGQGLEG